MFLIWFLFERDGPQYFVRETPSSQDSSSFCSYLFVCFFVKIHLLLVKYCNIFFLGKSVSAQQVVMDSWYHENILRFFSYFEWKFFYFIRR